MTSRPFGEPRLVDALAEEIEELRRALARAGGPLAGLVGRSAPMQTLFDEIFAAAARRDVAVVTGESGAGKRTVAAAIHRLSSRGREPVRSIAFDRRDDPPAPAEVARAARSGGTLVLEGLFHAPPEVQRAAAEASDAPGGARLVVVAREWTPDGALDPAIGDRTGAPIVVPPLRVRREDIPLLAEYFLRPRDPRDGAAPALDPKALDAMAAHEWSGNLRELRNVIRRARALSAGPVIGLTAIQSVLGGASARPERDAEASAEKEIVAVRIGDSMADIERRVLQRTLRFAKGNKRYAAEMLKLSLKTIYNKVKEYGLEREFNRRFRKEPRSE
ncbi:MAG TPA: helix-turn-helix domain-containing protein [Thermoanaerobaculia bacterium]|nr:helix-turn-helix domain-containing protein [Thermoanaerobaculia bacterium]